MSNLFILEYQTEMPYRINSGNWKDERMELIKKYLRDPNQDTENVARQINYYKNHKFTLKNGRVFVKLPSGTTKEVLSDSQARAKIKSADAHQEVDHVLRERATVL